MTKTEADLWLDYLFAPIRLIDAAAYAAGDESAPFFKNTGLIWLFGMSIRQAVC